MTGAAVKLERPIGQAAFARDALTWFGYALYGYWSYAWGLFGPVMPFIREELKLNYGIAALHFSALALGPLLAGLIGYHIIRRAGPARTIAGGMLLIVAGIALVLIGTNPACTICGAWLVGFGGSPAAQSIIACLTERFPANRSKTIVELTISSATFTALAPLAVAACINLGLNWKAAIFSAIPVLALIVLLAKTSSASYRWQLHETHANDSRALPAAYWLYFSIVFLSVSGEWSVCFWCTEYLERALHFSAANACAGLSAFLIAMFTGRLIGTRLTSTASTHKLLLLATATTAVGFFTFWLSSAPLLVVLGLIILGLGQSNVYPFALSAAIGASPGKAAKATATMSLSTGAAIFGAPLLLGMLADKIGIGQSYGLIAIFFAAALTAAAFAFAINRDL